MYSSFNTTLIPATGREQERQTTGRRKDLHLRAMPRFQTRLNPVQTALDKGPSSASFVSTRTDWWSISSFFQAQSTHGMGQSRTQDGDRHNVHLLQVPIQGLQFQVRSLYLTVLFLIVGRASSIPKVRRHCVESKRCPERPRFRDMKARHVMREKFMTDENIQRPHVKTKIRLPTTPILTLESRLEAFCKNKVSALGYTDLFHLIFC